MIGILVRVLVVASQVFLSACFHGEDKVETADEQIIERISLGSGSQASLFYIAGNAICQTLAKGKETGKIPCESLVSDGSTHNLLALQEGKVEFGIARADTVYRAWYGQAPFKERFTKLRVLFALNQEVVTLVVPKDADVTTFRSVSGRKIHVDISEPDNERVVLELLKTCKISTSDLTLVDDKKMERLSQGLSRRASDSFFSLLSHPDDALTIVARAHPLGVLPLTESCIEKMVDERSYYDRAVIPGAIYPGVSTSVPSFGVRLWVLTTIDVSEKAAHLIAEGVFEHLDELRQNHPAFHHLSPKEMLPQFSVPYHNGALKYYAEKGWFSIEGKQGP
ncbi:MAG: TAXI family TRAP transporter solute-binding subunit [Magnetococcales bacterium]|nr:TAXI family TRAP transporter solute-binding subunit [Magnetococcales bacterium]MBF0151831.1 TAXI family TRAP transporter solute-binding subunit [Magnetococcales bacterium]MBF0173366.1 TAXI family TRAP transporter solute-binding subunit [Magnetococcales bacterium]MBF0632774.1 TAXI family TRAP transporter solute-binding subunit [Magnetococcales bacterium]